MDALLREVEFTSTIKKKESREMTNYDEKMKAMEQVLEDHLKALPQADGIPRFDVQGVKNHLLHLGATSESALAQCSFEDLESCGIPKLLAKTVAAIFRNALQVEKPAWVSERTAERMTYEELLARYNPSEENAIFKKLKGHGEGKAFVVFQEGNQVDVVTSLKLLQEIKAGYGERPLLGISVNGTMKPIYKVGEKPDNLVDENPLYPGRTLRPDGTCDQLNRSWTGVPLKVRQLIYIAVKETKELQIASAVAHDILDLAVGSIDGDRLRMRYPKAAMLFQEKEKQGTLPTLKIELGKQTNKQNFPEGKRVLFP